MKNCVSFLLLLLVSRMCLSQNMVGNGGDIVASEFNMIARASIFFLKTKSLSTLDQNLVIEIEKKIKTTSVISVAEDLKLDGIVVDAINFPALNKIKISRKRWELIRLRSPSERAMIVLHEYIWIAGTSDASYGVSARLIKEILFELNRNSISTKNYWDALNEFYASLELYRTDIVKMQSKGSTNFASYCLNVGSLYVHIENIVQLTQKNIFWFSSYQNATVNDSVEYLKLFSKNQVENCRTFIPLDFPNQIESISNIVNIVYYLMRITKFQETDWH